MRRLLNLCLAAAALVATSARAADWVYFDLGEVVLSGTPQTGYTFVPGVLTYLEKLRDAGLQVGVITNTPETWGATCREKFSYLQSFVASHLKDTQPFPWSSFTAVVQPPADRYRKPQPLMFLDGLANACPGRALYISQKPVEVDAAISVGYAGFLKSRDVAWPEAEVVKQLLAEGFRFPYPANCDLQAKITASLLESDRATGIPDCLNLP